jgi:hypothetical protein
MRFTADDYSELLGLYLGDGCISDGARTSRLRISFDSKYPGIINDARALLERCFPNNPVGLVQADAGSVVVTSVYSSHLACLFSQDGVGKKHERPILLEAWQRQLVALAPWKLMRGLIRSDGCAFINRTGPYEYLSYDFTNRSKNIVDLFVSACRQVGVQYRVSRWGGKFHVRINRRPSVRLMLTEVGVKS